MGVTRTFVGYHTEDGGRVYKETAGNNLLSHTYCTVCQKSTALGNFNISTEIASDITAISVDLGGDIPGTDVEYKVALSQISSGWNTLWGASFGRLFPEQPFGCVHTVATVTDTIDNGIMGGLDEADIHGMAAAKSMVKSVVDDGTMAEVASPDGSTYIWNYFFSPSHFRAGLIDVTNNMETTTISLYESYMVCTDPTADATVISSTFVVPHVFTHVHLILQGDLSIGGDDYMDWTRPDNYRFYLSNDGGSTWTGAKAIDPYDGTFSGEAIHRTSIVDLGAAGTQFKWKLDFRGDAEFGKRAFKHVMAILYTDTADPFQSYVLEKYL